MNPDEIHQIGEYRVRRFIAEGGMAWVFEVEVPGFKQATLALKMLKPAIGGGDLFQRFREEAERLLVLDHPNLMRLHVFGRDEATGCHFYTMPLIDTPPLSDRGPIPLDEAIRFFLDALAGLAKLHDSNIIHRDIKPSNILIHPDGRAIVTDLGIARSAELSEGETWYDGRGATSTGVAIGTPAYMSPEQARGRRSITKATDIFSFGLTMYRLLTGLTVYHYVDDIDSRSGQEILAYLSHLSFGDSEFDFAFPPEIPEPIRAVIRRACRMDPAQRFPDAGAMRAALMSAVGMGPSPLAASPAPPRRPRWLAPAAGAFALVALGAVGWWFLHRAPPGIAPAAVQKLSQRSMAMIQEALAQGAPADVLAQAGKAYTDASALLQSSQDARKRSDADAARLYLRDAARGFESACGTLVTKYFTPTLGSEAQKLAQQAGGLRDAGQALQPKRWSDFENGLASLAKPARLASSCDTADAVRAQLATGRKLAKDLPGLQEAIASEGQRVVATARDRALAAQQSAEQAEVDAPEFKKALAGAQGLLSGAQAIDPASKPLAARDAFGAAGEAFAKAGTVAQAAMARERAAGLRTEAAALIQQDRALGAQIARADQLYAQESWQPATAAYDELSKRLESELRAEKAAEPARQARLLAEKARDQARTHAAKTIAPDAFADAEKQLAAGERAFGSQRFDDARKAYEGAASAFDDAGRKAAGEIERARSAGQDAKASRAALGSDCSALPPGAREPCTRASDALGRGDAALARNDVQGALESYATASQAVQAARDAKDRVASLEALRAQAREARAAAPHAGAEKSAPPELAAAADRLAAADRALGSGRTDEAKAAFADAKAGFAKAQQAATQAIGRARSAGQKAKAARDALGRDCAQVPEAAQSDCRAASAALGHGQAALAANDAPTAAASFAEALSDAERARAHAKSARAAEAAREREKPTPPEIVSRSPRTDRIGAHRGEHVTFEVAARDARPGAALRYQWTVDGRKRPETGPRFELEAERTAAVELRVEDPGGLSTSTHWQVHVENRKPVLALSPAGSRLDVALGSSLAFDARATDPDGDPVTISYHLDGKLVGSGAHFAFHPEKAGTYQLAVRAEDADGEVAMLDRRIQVTPRRSDPRAVAEATLREYQAAYQAQKIDRLAAVWEMSGTQRESMARFFGNVKNLSISVSLEPKSVRQEGDRISAVFHQKVQGDGISPSDASLRATLVKQGSTWRIQALGPP